MFRAKHLIILGIVYSFFLPALAGNTACAEQQKPIPGKDSAQTTSQSNGKKSEAPGYRVYKDPVTGEFLEAPPADAEDVQKANAASQPPPTLMEEPSPVPGGGTMIRLQGQHRAETKATKDKDGKTTIHCEEKTPRDPATAP